MSEKGFVVVLCTAGQTEAEKLAEALVTERLAACVNAGPVRSCYIWEGKLCWDAEVLLIIKTAAERVEAIKKRISELHSYAVPEVIVLPIVDGSSDYLDWVNSAVESDQ
jgi:periplasmic divalent cation tolerance protein